MESLMSVACENAHSAHWVIFLLLLLAGLNIPISEDILLISAGAIASTCIPEKTFYLFAWVYAGCLISAWETYWIGRYFGPKLYNIRWFCRVITPKRIEKLHETYEKYGVLTFMIIRFCPGGIRNALFLTAGLGKMPFLKFILRDSFAASLSVSTIFYLGYYFGSNYQTIINYFYTYSHFILGCGVVAIFAYILYKWQRSRMTLV